MHLPLIFFFFTLNQDLHYKMFSQLIFACKTSVHKRCCMLLQQGNSKAWVFTDPVTAGSVAFILYDELL